MLRCGAAPRGSALGSAVVGRAAALPAGQRTGLPRLGSELRPAQAAGGSAGQGIAARCSAAECGDGAAEAAARAALQAGAPAHAEWRGGT